MELCGHMVRKDMPCAACDYYAAIGEAIPVGDTESQVIADIQQRQQRGLAKYGTTVAGNPLPLREWLQHQYEELLDAAIYCKRAMQEMDK